MSEQSQRNALPVMSVSIPCYNYGRYLEDCVASVLSQEGVRPKVLIVDDASSDDSGEIGRGLAERHDGVEYMRHAENSGHIATFNDGVEWACGLGFALLSADDLLAAGALRRAADVLLAHPNVGMVYGEAHVFTEVPPPVLKQEVTTTVIPGLTWLRRRCATAENNTYSPEIVLRSEVQRTIGGYDGRLKHTSDLHMWLRAAAVSDVGRLHGATQAFYRVHGANMSMGFGSAALDLEQRRAAFSLFFEDPWVDQQRRNELERLVRRALSRDAVDAANRAIDDGDAAVDQQELIDFAVETDAAVRRRPTWWGHRLRRALGSRERRRLLPPFVFGRGARWLRYKLRNPRLRRLRD